MVEKLINIQNYEKNKFQDEFYNYKKVVIIHEEKKTDVKSYKEFLNQFSFNTSNSINEMEEFLISFIKCIAIMKGIEIDVSYKKYKRLDKYNNEKNKEICMENLQSIIDIIVELNIAKILIVY